MKKLFLVMVLMIGCTLKGMVGHSLQHLYYPNQIFTGVSYVIKMDPSDQVSPYACLQQLYPDIKVDKISNTNIFVCQYCCKKSISRRESALHILNVHAQLQVQCVACFKRRKISTFIAHKSKCNKIRAAQLLMTLSGV